MVDAMPGPSRSLRVVLGAAAARRDLGLAVLLGVVSMQSAFDGGGLKEPAVVVIGLIELSVLPIAFRRMWPVPVLAITLGAAVAGEAVIESFHVLGPAIALYTVARECEYAVAVKAAAATAVVLVWPASIDASENPLFAAGIYAVFVAAWAFGSSGRSRQAFLTELRARADQLEREQAERERRAVVEERARIARELHDVISHSVSVMVVQAAAARDVFDAEPELAREALGAIEDAGRDALTELRRLLGVIRPASAGGVEREPQPGLARLPDLVEQATGAGLRVELEVVGKPPAVPAGVDVSAYRLVQEALTNTLKHAGRARATVVVSYSDANVTLAVVDDGRGIPVERRSGATGLLAMENRAATIGARLTVAPGPGGRGSAVQLEVDVNQNGGPAWFE